jgi:RNA polymerase sigma-70 factor, ECF subfamily
VAVSLLEPVEDLDEQLEPVAVDGTRPWPRRLADVHPDAEDDVLGGLGQDPGDLLSVHENVVRMLDRGLGADRAGHRFGGDEGELGPPHDRQLRPQYDREREAGSCLVHPYASKPTAPGGLVLGERDGAMQRVVCRHRLGRRGLGRVQIRAAEASAQPGLNDLGHEPHAVYSVPAVQPPSSQGRRTTRGELFAGTSLAYDRLSDAILVTRAKAGDPAALAALCERYAPRVEKIALHLLRDPEDARDAAQDSLAKLVVRIRQFRGESQFSTWLHRLVVNTCKDFAQARALRRTEPLIADERPARDGDPVAALTASETRRELGRCLAELPPAQATVVALKDAFDLGFAEISSATGLPVGTAKCYAHRGRATMRSRLSA